MGKKAAVLVTTAHRGVFFGYIVGKPTKAHVRLERARNVVYWSADTRGFLGLAESGPTQACRVGPAAAEITLYDITSVVTCSSAAASRFEDAPWA